MNKRAALKFGIFLIIFLSVFLSFLFLNLVHGLENYTIGDELRIDLTAHGEYRAKITTPSGEFVQKGNSEILTIKAEEVGEYHVLVSYSQGEESFDFLINPGETKEEPLTEEEMSAENLAESSQIIINEPVKWTIKETLNNEPLQEIIPLEATDVKVFTGENGEKMELEMDMEVLVQQEIKTIQTEEITGEVELVYYTEAPRTREKVISEKEKEVVVFSPENIHYENVLAYTSIPETTSDPKSVRVFWKEENIFLESSSFDEDGDGLIDSVEWIVPHLSEQTFQIIVITRAEHLNENRGSISDIYEEVKSLDGIWSEEIPQDHYVRVVFERPLQNTNDITIFPRITSGNPIIEIYEKDGSEIIASFTEIIENEYNKVFLTNYNGASDTFDLKIIGGSVEFDQIIDPASTVLINAGASSTSTSTTTGFFSGGKNIIRLNDNNMIAYWENAQNDASCANSTSGGVSWSANISEAGTHGDLAVATNGSAIMYMITEEGQADLDYIYRTTNTCDIASGAFADVGANTNDNWRPDIAYDGAKNIYFVCSTDNDDLDIDIARTPAATALTWTITTAVGGARAIDSCSIDVNDVGNVYVAGDDNVSGIFVFNSSANFSSTTTVRAYSNAVNKTHISIRGSQILITAVDTNFDLVVINSSDGLVYSNVTLAGTFSEAEGCIDSAGQFHLAVSDGSDIDYIQYSKGRFGDFFTIADAANNLRWPAVRCSNFPTNNRMDDGRLDLVYTMQTANDIYFANFSIPTNDSIYGNPLVTIVNPQENHTTSTIPFNFTLNEPGVCNFTLNGGVTNYTTTANANFTIFNATNTSISDGTYTTNVYCFDLAGNSNLSVSRTFVTDENSPIVSIITPLNQQNFSSSTRLFNITSNENSSSCQYTLNAGLTNISMSSTDTLVWNATNTSIADGTYTANFTCADYFAHNGTNSTTFRIDTTPPSVVIVHPTARNYSTTSLSLNFTITDAIVGVQACYYSLNGGVDNTTISNCENTTITANEGANTLHLYANDSLGNTNRTTNVSFFVDTVFPLIQFVAPTVSNGSTSGETYIHVNLSITEINTANMTFELYNISSGQNHLVNRTTFTTLTTWFNWTNLNNTFMNYTYNVTIIDVAGNTNSTETRYITLTPGDIEPPEITFVNPPSANYLYNSSSVQFNITLNEQGSAIRFRINNSNTNYSMSSTTNITWNATNTSIADGFYTLIVFANDTAGNTENANRTFRVDNSAPLISFGVGTENDGVNVSRNWTFVNVTVTEPNEILINFTIYNSTALVNSTSFTDFRRTINWTDLPDGNYIYNVSITDETNRTNSTARTIRLDRTAPTATLLLPLNNSVSTNRTQNLTINATDNLALYNLTLFVFNVTNSIINQTTINNYSVHLVTGIHYTFPYDGNFSWNYLVSDSAGNINQTSNFTILIDSTAPQVNFTSPTASNATEFERDWIYVNTTVNETNFANITFTLFNQTGSNLVNVTIFSDGTREINWTNLSSANMTYRYNVTVTDIANNRNSTETRTIKLYDATLPTLNLIEPQNRTYFYNVSVPLTFNVSDLNLQACWYTINAGVTNNSVANCQSTEINVTEGSNTLFFYVNDSVGLTSSDNVTFVANASLLRRRGGLLAYGYGTLGSPYYRFWNGTGFTGNVTAASTGGTIQWVRAKQSPSRAEQIIMAATSAFDVSVQINGTLPGTETVCWHNGTSCGRVLNLTLTSTSISRQKFDVAYETKGDDAIVVWSDNDLTPQYQIWNGTNWGVNQSIPQTLITGGLISYLKLASNPLNEEVALIMTNTTALDILIWNGTNWGCEPSSLPLRTLTPDVFQHSDVIYEQVSGDLFVASTFDSGAISEFNYTTKASGSCTYVTSTTTTIREEAEIISVGARYGSDHIMISVLDISGGANSNDLDGIIWNGTAMLAISGNDATTYSDVSPNILIGAGWAGTSPHGIRVYSDAATTANNVNYNLYNITANLWYGGANALNATGITDLTDEEQNIIVASYVEENKTLVIIQDESDDLWAKAYNGDTNSWSQPDNGAALSDNVASTVFPAFNFEFNYDRYGPQVIVNSPRSYTNSTSVLFNITALEEVSICSYSVDGGSSSSLSGTRDLTGTSTHSEGQHNVTFTCEDIWENSRDNTAGFIIDTNLPIVNFTSPTASNGTLIERTWIFVNVSVNETNEANITFTIHNLTALVNLTTLGAGNRTINWTNLPLTFYYYNVTVTDLANNRNSTETRTINLTRIPPVVNLLYPSNGFNFSSYTITQFNFSVSDNSSIANCSLYGNWTASGWHLNQTITSPSKDVAVNFSSKLMPNDGFYIWNVLCTDEFNTQAFNSTNFTFSTFLPPDSPALFNITQTSNDGSGNITILWNSSNHSTYYRVYSGLNFTNFSLVNTTTTLNFTDTSFSGNTRRFYYVEGVNPVATNQSSQFFAAHLYTLRHNGNTRNWIAFPTNASYLPTANRTLYEVRNATAVTMWNATIQTRTTCNLFSCPSTPSCTTTNCNFARVQGQALEVNLNTSAPSAVNWSLVGIVYPKTNISLIKNATDFGKNWISLWANTSLVKAHSVLNNISSSDAISIWNSSSQTSVGLIRSPFPFGPTFLGNNFTLEMEQGYEVSVNTSINWTQS